MKQHYEPYWQVDGGPPHDKLTPVDADLIGTHEECSAVMIAFSYKLNTWVIADAQGNVLAEGEPVELAEWMKQYFIHLCNMIDRNAG